MELIIKPTERCNFACTFCSSTSLVEDKKQLLDLERIYAFLRRFPETNSIIVNGGDPLMMPPTYYRAILDFIESEDLPTSLSFTTNLWAFYRNPDLWTDIFRHPRVGVTTSFNYGSTRRISPDKVFTEELFWSVSDLFLERIGYRPGFISVITEENGASAIDNVELAKRMDVECKLNYAVASGEQKQTFLKGKIYRVYLEIIRRGWAQWEYNSKQLLRMKHSLVTTCPLNRSCDESIRCLQPDGAYFSCGAFGDDRLYPIEFEDEMKSQVVARPLSQDPAIAYLKDDCLSCPLFKICNGCKKTIMDVKRQGAVQAHCDEMQSLLEDLREYVS